MATISLCMIVKNEEKILARCLDSVKDLMDEIIIIDTGSTDRTKEIAKNYTNQVFDFTWCDDFSAARNFSFSKANMEYIYAPDADEFLDAENRCEFAKLKEALLPEIEIVQMKYCTISEFDTVLNAKTEYRPKLFKRQREFTWIDPVHETVRLDPVVFNSDIVIMHQPESFHGKRDFSIFEKMIASGQSMSDKLFRMYATELIKVGEVEDLRKALPLFADVYEQGEGEYRKLASIVLAKFYEESEDDYNFTKLVIKDVTLEPTAELCFFLGKYYQKKQDIKEASLWFMNAYYETEAVLDIHLGGDRALTELANCYAVLYDDSQDTEERTYFHSQLELTRKEIEAWQMPEEA